MFPRTEFFTGQMKPNLYLALVVFTIYLSTSVGQQVSCREDYDYAVDNIFSPPSYCIAHYGQSCTAGATPLTANPGGTCACKCPAGRGGVLCELGLLSLLGNPFGFSWTAERRCSAAQHFAVNDTIRSVTGQEVRSTKFSR